MSDITERLYVTEDGKLSGSVFFIESRSELFQAIDIDANGKLAYQVDGLKAEEPQVSDALKAQAEAVKKTVERFNALGKDERWNAVERLTGVNDWSPGDFEDGVAAVEFKTKDIDKLLNENQKQKVEIQSGNEKRQEQEEKIDPANPKKIGKLLSKGAEFWQTQQHSDGMLYFKQLPDGQRLELLDKGDRISGDLSKDPVQLGAQIELMLALAKEKGWKELDINTKDKEVKEALARAAVAAGLGVKDKNLERQAREQLGFKPQVSMGAEPETEKDPAVQVAKEAGVPNPQRVELKPGEKAEGRIIGMDDKNVYQHLGGNKVTAHPKTEMEKQIDLAKAVGAKVEISRGKDGELKATMPRRPIPTREQQVQAKVNDLER